LISRPLAGGSARRWLSIRASQGFRDDRSRGIRPSDAGLAKRLDDDQRAVPDRDGEVGFPRPADQSHREVAAQGLRFPRSKCFSEPGATPIVDVPLTACDHCRRRKSCLSILLSGASPARMRRASCLRVSNASRTVADPAPPRPCRGLRATRVGARVRRPTI